MWFGGFRGVDGSTYYALGRWRGNGVCMAGLGLSGSGVHTRGKGGSSWRRRSPKEEEARGPPLLCVRVWVVAVSPVNPGI